MTIPVAPTGYPFKSISASTLIKTGPGVGVMIHVTSSTSLVIKVWDGTSASGTVILANLAVAAKEQIVFPPEFTTGLYIEFISGSGALTVYYV